MRHIKSYVSQSSTFSVLMAIRKRLPSSRQISERDDSNAPPKRLRILAEEEQCALYGLPRFTPEQRTEYFSLSQPEKELLQEFRSLKSKAYFVLQLGYFKAKCRFFVMEPTEIRKDLEYILDCHFRPEHLVDSAAIDKNTRLRQQRLILKLFRYQNCGAAERQRLEAKARQAAAICSKPVYIFRELTRFLEEEHIIAPEYSSLQDSVGRAITFEQQRLTGILRRHVTPADHEALRRLLEDMDGLHEITRLKRDPKDFTNSEVKQEVRRRGEQIRDLYRLAERLLPELAISNDSVRYYASLVMYYSVYRLKRFGEWTAYLYVLCFVHHRYRQFHDNLIGSLRMGIHRRHG